MDHYSTLNVSRDASAATIKVAYHKLALKVHPDKNTSSTATASFRRRGHAYEVLSDTSQRSGYDAQSIPKHAKVPATYVYPIREILNAWAREEQAEQERKQREEKQAAERRRYKAREE